MARIIFSLLVIAAVAIAGQQLAQSPGAEPGDTGGGSWSAGSISIATEDPGEDIEGEMICWDDDMDGDIDTILLYLPPSYEPVELVWNGSRYVSTTPPMVMDVAGQTLPDPNGIIGCGGTVNGSNFGASYGPPE